MKVAAELYTNGNYEEASAKYEYLLNSGINNHIIYYNLGNCYFKLGQLGKCILFYRKAQKLKPADSDINFNLNFVRSRRVDEIKRAEIPKVFKFFVTILTYPDIDILVIISSALYFGIISIVCVSLFRKVRGNTIKIGLSIVLGIVLALVLLNLARLNRQEGVVLAKVVDVRSGPSQEYTLIFTIHEGMEVRILEEQNGWLKIILPDGLGGWIKADQIGKI